jgi:hypothetical protein
LEKEKIESEPEGCSDGARECRLFYGKSGKKRQHKVTGDF